MHFDMKLNKYLLITGCLLASAMLCNANAIINGGFEDPQLPSGGWATYSSIPGWQSVGNYPIEIGWVNNYGISGQEGNQVLELDSTGNAMVAQTTTSPGSYTLSFLYAGRADHTGIDSAFDVLWNNLVIGSFSPLNTAMALASFNVNATGSDTLAFRGAGLENSYGALIDDVQLNPRNSVPDGGMTVSLLGMAMTGLFYLRRKV